MQVTTGFVQALRDAGLDVVEMPGWQNRGESGSFNIRGLLLHHDASGLHNDNVPNYMKQNGVNGAQLWVKYTGQVYILAAGLKWHAGVGGGFRNIPANGGNAYCVGVETDYSGTGPRDPRIDEAIHKLTRVAVVYYKMDPNRDLALHREYAPDRKIDLSNFDSTAWRTRASTGITPGPPPTPEPIPPVIYEDEEDMYRLVRGDSGPNVGMVFAAAPGRFFHVADPDHYATGVLTGMWKDEVQTIGLGQLDQLRDVCIGNNSDKDMNIVGSPMPSDYVQGKV